MELLEVYKYIQETDKKTVAIIESCDTLDQVDSAYQWTLLLRRRWMQLGYKELVEQFTRPMLRYYDVLIQRRYIQIQILNNY